jgi:hypothetical protein
MNHKASAVCKNGHSFEFGSCGSPVEKLFGGVRACSCNAFEQIYGDRTTTTVSFDDTPWTAVRCLKCKAVHDSRSCPICSETVPITAFKKKGLWAKLG